jgi:hypothetical protein
MMVAVRASESLASMVFLANSGRENSQRRCYVQTIAACYMIFCRLCRTHMHCALLRILLIFCNDHIFMALIVLGSLFPASGTRGGEGWIRCYNTRHALPCDAPLWCTAMFREPPSAVITMHLVLTISRNSTCLPSLVEPGFPSFQGRPPMGASGMARKELKAGVPQSQKCHGIISTARLPLPNQTASPRCT